VSSTRYAAASELFLAVCELPPAERAAYLESACRGDPELRAEVESLLSYDVDPASIEPDAPPHQPLAPGALFANRYRVVAQLGRGGVGVVYRAVDERLGQTVALKVLRTSSPARREQLAREVRLARQVTHPAVCRVYDFEEAGHECFLSMELVDGENLATLLLRVGRLAPNRVLAIARDVLDGLAVAHASGVLHRDLKPANLLMNAAGRVWITDFGIATGGDAADALALPAGTPAYMAPEQRSGAALSAQADLYSLGVLLYELVTGARPGNPPEPPSRRVPDVDPRLERAILCALEPEPARRPSSARVMLGMIEAPDAEAAPEPSPERAAEPEQRRITVMFVARGDSNEFAPSISPDELQEILSAERAAIRRVLARHGGVVTQRLGRQQLVLFGYPVAREDAPMRAVAAALEVQEAILLLERELSPRLSAPLAVRIGIHSGPAIVEVPEGETDAFAYGATIDAVIALAERARPGEVLASADLQRRVGSARGWVPSGSVVVPGVAEPLRVFEVWSQAGAGAPDAPVAPFVGRERELAQLLDRYRRAAAGEGQLVLVRGESGVGKSRLIDELRARLASSPHRWLQAQCTPYTENTPLYPYSQILAQASDVPPDLPAPMRNQRLRAALADLQIDRPDLLPPLERLLAMRLVDEPARNPKAERDAAYAAIFAVSKRAGEITPLVIVLEDLHWADPSSLEMLQLAHGVRAEVRVLLVCTMRPELELVRPARDNALEIQLGPLDPDQTRRVAEFFAGGRVAEPSLDAIVRRAEGNPLFAAELARHARETRSPDTAIPASLHDSLMARLDRLGDEKRVAQIASVLGRTFTRDMMRILAGFASEEELEEALHQLEERQLIAGTGLPPGAQYEFRHALIRDAAYESIPPRRRAALHAQAAEALAQAHPDWNARNPEVIAHHHECAGQDALAAAGWERAADRAFDTAAHIEATRHLERALANAARMPGSRERDELELRVQLKLGRSLLATRGRNAPEVERTFARAHALCRAHAPTPSVFGGLSEIWVHSATLCDGRALAMVSELAQVASACGDCKLEALAAGALAQLYHFMGRPADAIDAAERALAHIDAAQHTSDPNSSPAVDALSLVHVSIARSAWLLGFPDRAREEAQRALAVARAFGEPYNEGLADSLIAYVHLWCGEDDRALELAEANLARASRFGYGLFEAAALGIRSEVRLRGGRPQAALEDTRAELEIRRALGHVLGTGLAQLQLAQALARTGDLAAAIHAAREAVRFSSLPDDCALLAEAHRVLGLLLLRRDRASEEGDAALARALAVAREQQALSLELRAAMAIARSPRGDVAPLQSAYARFREGFDTADLMEAKGILASTGARSAPLAH
jgi:serine/threonine protein kinase/tetratricopeptide (TPR) repeat protein